MAPDVGEKLKPYSPYTILIALNEAEHKPSSRPCHPMMDKMSRESFINSSKVDVPLQRGGPRASVEEGIFG
ncbi:hypothetical protein AOLI_G00179810 [Acnodon oligacanthus]